MISLQDVSRRIGQRAVLTDIGFDIRPGEFVCITGPSGAGKTTLMHVLIGAETVTAGSVHVDGVDLRRVPPRALQMYRRRIGVVFQDYKLLWNRTVAENVAFPLEICGASMTTITKRVGEVLEALDMASRSNVLCHALSGGEKARTAIGRAIVHKPMIVLADEPTGNLDPQESMRILDLFRAMHQHGATVILATHDTTIVDALQTRVIRLEAGRVARDSVGSYAPERKNERPTKKNAPAPHKSSRKHSSVKIVSTSR
ncbi:MAG: ATP-binding cassette domain-containing protein [Candidatus Peribacteraceae bacterium]